MVDFDESNMRNMLWTRRETVELGTFLMEPKRIELPSKATTYPWAESPRSTVHLDGVGSPVAIPLEAIVPEHVAKVHELLRSEIENASFDPRPTVIPVRRDFRMLVVFKEPMVEEAWNNLEADLAATRREAHRRLRAVCAAGRAGLWRRLKFLFSGCFHDLLNKEEAMKL